MFRRGAIESKRQPGMPRRPWLAGVAALLLLLVFTATGYLDPVERKFYQQVMSLFASKVDSDSVAVITVSQQQGLQGRLADIYPLLKQAETVAITLPLSQQENGTALKRLKQHLARLKEQEPESPSESIANIQSLIRELDSTARLAKALSENGNTILASTYRSNGSSEPANLGASFTANRWPQGGMPLEKMLSGVVSQELPKGKSGSEPIELLQSSAWAVGGYSDDTYIYPTVVATEQGVLPTLLLQILRNHKGDDKSKDGVQFYRQGEIAIGEQRYKSDAAFRLYPDARINRHDATVPQYPLETLHKEQVDSADFHDRIVMIGLESDPHLVPFAQALSAVMQQKLIRVPTWAPWLEYGATLIVALLLILLMPRLGYGAALVVVLLLSLLLVNSEVILLAVAKQWQPLALPLLLLWLSYPLITLHRMIAQRQARLELELSSANRHLGRLLQSQGDLEQALGLYRRVVPDNELCEQLYHLGLDFERKRQYAKAVSALAYLNEVSPDFRDVAERIERNQAMEKRVALPSAAASSSDATVIMSSAGLQNPTLGPYQIEHELGRGAMGMVYLGKDPRIGRAVAIKTMALSSEFEGKQLDEVKQRFYREAETAGRLNHPNIVHIYDIGEEQELAYIAMDFLKGEPLGKFSQVENLMPIPEVLAVVEQVAEALDYAHKQSVVHRDIKPANIIYDQDSGVVKVTDFGVACLTDSSKTKTGTVLGSPSYMSPEQVAGKRVDGRADIFSLGVTMFQLITGRLPFEADSLGSLMYKIANSPHPKPSRYRKGIPVCVSRIINKAMQKEQDNRYQSAADMAAALKRCRNK